LWLWWPLRIFGFRKGASFRRLNLDLHSVTAHYSSLVLIVVCVAGVSMRNLHVEHTHSPGSHAPQAGAQRISVDQTIQAAENALPGTRAATVEMPPPNTRASYLVQLTFLEDGYPAGRSVVFVDQWSGKPLAVHSAREGSLLELYDNLQLSLHTGAVGGTVTRWIAFFVCVAVLLQISPAMCCGGSVPRNFFRHTGFGCDHEIASRLRSCFRFASCGYFDRLAALSGAHGRSHRSGVEGAAEVERLGEHRVENGDARPRLLQPDRAW
jgi:uncharacterized iron-regulated membrane protein